MSTVTWTYCDRCGSKIFEYESRISAEIIKTNDHDCIKELASRIRAIEDFLQD